ncbi:EF-hand domain-containing family member B isoform X2 [Brienomyrus brachyistius]|uniref:EF-hand domain-containing family member B isoform X2 n=1 Tax=Brienomyrus brachyistius TaxID=42636 RepID=UPI0020B17FFA|nr:EF-hand domain-containing family member B isoform X2 [Brienomyrus brachyistius]
MTQTEQNTTHVSSCQNWFPNIHAAGKHLPTDDEVKTCLQMTPRPATPPVIKKFLNTRRPEVGATRVFYGKAGDPDIASALRHGVMTKASVNGGLVINPKPNTVYQHRLQQLQEAGYFSNSSAPLGRSHDQRSRLPPGLDPSTTAFGVKSTQSVKAGVIINPLKTPEQVKKESEEGHQLYVRSHHAYSVGERISRNYNCSHVRGDCRFGLSTPHYNDGRRVAKSLHWLQNEGKLVSMRYDDFRRRTQPQTGKVHDPIAETLNVPENHTFGILSSCDKFGVGDILYQGLPEGGLRGTNERRSLVIAARQHLKRDRFHNFTPLLQAFRHFDKNGEGFINKEELQDACHMFNLDLSTPVLDAVMEICGRNEDGQIDFLGFFDLLNWRDNLTIKEWEEQILTGDSHINRLQRAKTAAASETRTRHGHLEQTHVDGTLRTPRARPRTVPSRSIASSSMMHAVVGGPTCDNARTYGVPTVHTDLAAQPVKRLGDRTNYGDASAAHGLLHPTIYSQKGVPEEVLFTPRTKEEISQIFRNLGVDISEAVFEEAWKLASVTHPRGKVCVEVFRNVLKEMQAY